MGDRLDKTDDFVDEEDEGVVTPPKRPFFSFFDLNKFLGELLRLIIYFIVFFVIYSLFFDGSTNLNSYDAISTLDRENQILGEISLVGSEIVLDEMLINTSDELENHFVKATVVISYGSPETGIEINRRINQIYDRIRKVFSSKRISEIKYVDGQELISLEIKREIQKITGKIDIYNIFFKDFTVY